MPRSRPNRPQRKLHGQEEEMTSQYCSRRYCPRDFFWKSSALSSENSPVVGEDGSLFACSIPPIQIQSDSSRNIDCDELDDTDDDGYYCYKDSGLSAGNTRVATLSEQILRNTHHKTMSAFLNLCFILAREYFPLGKSPQQSK